jgi:hypothetical protein
MNNAEKCLLVAAELRECAAQHGPLSQRAKMLILAERLENLAGGALQPEAVNDKVQLALSAYAKLMRDAKSGSEQGAGPQDRNSRRVNAGSGAFR